MNGKRNGKRHKRDDKKAIEMHCNIWHKKDLKEMLAVKDLDLDQELDQEAYQGLVHYLPFLLLHTSKAGCKKVALFGPTVTIRHWLMARSTLFVITVLTNHGFSIAVHQLQNIILQCSTWINYQKRLF